MKALTLFLLLICVRAEAFDIYPEYQGFSASDLSKFERPADLDAEYQSHLLSYRLPLAWDEWYWAQARALDTSVGSITNQHFFQNTRAKFIVPLAEKLQFRFIAFAQRDREVDQSRQILELRYEFLPGLFLAAYGEPSHYKRENDLGFALLSITESGWETRFFVTQHDFTRNEHNDEKDFFASGKSPTSIGLVSVKPGRDLFLRYGFRSDQPTEWRKPQESRVVHYSRDLAFLDVRWTHAEGRSLIARAQWDSSLEASEPGASWRLERWQSLISESFGEIWEVGAMYASRKWTTTGDAQTFHRNILPHLAVNFRGSPRYGDFDRVRLMVSATDFRSDGPNVPPEQKRKTIQGRFDARYEWSLMNGARLGIAGTFDLDEFPTFEGGNAIFRTGF